ncbi:MAG: S-adenosylmethionine:tRNA ribosyltransferase-isomerase [Candidatus Hydrogenedentes bacterium]|nr:S-adenosylmethionine:tRNA ribosyltransferase-isomerase [Candidatus Hydrogenedentota bacterium]
MSVRLKDFEYSLPTRLIAQHPLPRRDGSRLMLLSRAGGGVFNHHNFVEIPGLLRSGDVLVLNDTKVIPARFFCQRTTKGRVEGLFLREIRDHPGGAWEVLLKNAGRCGKGEHLTFENRQEAALRPTAGSSCPKTARSMAESS